MKIIQIAISPSRTTSNGSSTTDVIYGLSDDGSIYSFENKFRAEKEWTLCIPNDEKQKETVK